MPFINAIFCHYSTYRHSSPTTYYLLTYVLTYSRTFLISPCSTVLEQKLKFLRSSRNSPHFLKPEGPLPHAQQPTICPHPDTTRSSPHPPSHFLKMHGNIILSSATLSSNLSFFLTLPHRIPVYAPPHLHTHYVPPPSHSTYFITRKYLGGE